MDHPFQVHICCWGICSIQHFWKINPLKCDFSIHHGFVPLIFHIIIQFPTFLDYLTIKFGKYYYQRNCGYDNHWSNNSSTLWPTLSCSFIKEVQFCWQDWARTVHGYTVPMIDLLVIYTKENAKMPAKLHATDLSIDLWQTTSQWSPKQPQSLPLHQIQSLESHGR